MRSATAWLLSMNRFSSTTRAVVYDTQSNAVAVHHYLVLRLASHIRSRVYAVAIIVTYCSMHHRIW